MKIRIYHLCSSQHIVGPIPTLGNSLPKIGLTCRSNATRDFERKDFMITYREPPSFKDMVVRAKISQPRTTTCKGCNRPNTCKCCKKISQWGKIKNLHKNKPYNTMTKDTCQSNNLIYCLECNWCHTKYVGQTKTQNHRQIPRSYI